MTQQAFPYAIAGAAIFDASDRLFLMQSSGKFGAQWIIPGGKVSFGETLEAAVRREVVEETGLELRDVQLLGTREFIEPMRHFICFEFQARLHGDGKVSLNNEARTFRWCSRKDLDQIEVAPLTRALIDERLLPRGLPR